MKVEIFHLRTDTLNQRHQIERQLENFRNMRTEEIADFFAIRNGNELEKVKKVRWSFYRYWLDIYREDFYARVDHVQQDYKVI